MPAANIMGFSFLSRTAEQCDDPDSLLAGIRDETEQIRRYRLSLFFLGMLGAVNAVPGALRRFVRGQRCFATAVLTNLGDPTRRFVARFPRRNGYLVAGNLLLESISGVPPLRPMTRTAIAIITYAGQLTISLCCDPHHFSPADTQEFLNQYRAQLDQSKDKG
jgi:hypothetical protein